MVTQEQLFEQQEGERRRALAQQAGQGQTTPLKISQPVRRRSVQRRREARTEVTLAPRPSRPTKINQVQVRGNVRDTWRWSGILHFELKDGTVARRESDGTLTRLSERQSNTALRLRSTVEGLNRGENPAKSESRNLERFSRKWFSELGAEIGKDLAVSFIPGFWITERKNLSRTDIAINVALDLITLVPIAGVAVKASTSSSKKVITSLVRSKNKQLVPKTVTALNKLENGLSTGNKRTIGISVKELQDIGEATKLTTLVNRTKNIERNIDDISGLSNVATKIKAPPDIRNEAARTQKITAAYQKAFGASKEIESIPDALKRVNEQLEGSQKLRLGKAFTKVDDEISEAIAKPQPARKTRPTTKALIAGRVESKPSERTDPTIAPKPQPETLPIVPTKKKLGTEKEPLPKPPPGKTTTTTKPVPPVRLPGGKGRKSPEEIKVLQTPQGFPKIVGFKKGAFFVVANLQTGRIVESRIRPKGLKRGRGIKESFTILEIGRIPPTQKELNIGILKATISGRSVTLSR